MLSYFNPVYPDETGETVRGNLVDVALLKQIPTHPLPFVVSTLQEIQSPVQQEKWQNNYFTVNSPICQKRGFEAEDKFIEACS
jgi:hypothetical protein